MASVKPATWSFLKVEYESGKYKSLAELHEKLSNKVRKQFGNMPTYGTLEKKCETAGWKKAALLPLVEKSMMQKKIEHLASRNIEPEKFALDKSIELMMAEKTEIVRDRQAQDGEAKGFVQQSPDYYAQEKGLSHFIKLMGLATADKLDANVDGNMKTTVNWILTHGDSEETLNV